MVKKFKFNSPKSFSKILASSFWWSMIIHLWDVGFLKSKAIEFHGLGWVSMFDVWVASIRRLASKEEMGEKFVLSPEEDLGYERIVIKLEELRGFNEKGRQLLQRSRLDWFARRKQGISSMVCRAPSIFTPKCNNDVPHLHLARHQIIYCGLLVKDLESH
jgi:hypothetical protein